MFTLYGINGPVPGVWSDDERRLRGLARAQGVRPIAAGVAGAAAPVAPVVPRPQREAVEAYEQVQHVDLERGPLYRAAQLMRGPVVTVGDGDGVGAAWRVLRDENIRQAPVVDAAGTPVGIVTERDLLTAVDIDGDRVIEVLTRIVRDVMTTPVVAATPDTDIRRIAAVMLEHGVDAVPILNEGGRLVGIVSRSDILRATVSDPPLSLWR